jgi:beta-galactosidase
MDRRIFLKTAAGTVCVSAANPVLRELVAATKTPGFSSVPALFGADYYPDQTAETLWKTDAQMMAEFGITNVRIAEFAWALMEPAQGKFDFGWLHRSVDILNAQKIAVILGTPSAAPPPWLTQKYPEVMMVDEHGMTLSTEGRRFTCPTNKTYRGLSLAIATEMANSFANTQGVFAWQIDNEFTLSSVPRCFCKYCRAGFQDWLKDKYGALEAINETWGTVFWSQTYTDFAQIPVPLPSGAVPNPGMALDYDRYQSAANVSFMEEQLQVLRKLCPTHLVTTNNVPVFAEAVNLRDLYGNLDFVSSDNYPGFFSIYAAGESSGVSVPAQLLASSIALTHDFSRSIKDGKPFQIMEEQVGKAGQPIMAPQPEKGQLRLWSYQAVAHGAMGINYFRWDTANFGAEEYWHGLLNHDRSKSPGYAEIGQTIRELKSLGYDALNASYEAKAAMCFNYSSDWAVTIQPGQPKVKYVSEFSIWYGSLWGGQVGVDIVDGGGDLSRYKILFAPLMYIVTEKQAKNIREFVKAGGVFVSGFRLGVKDSASRIVSTPLPGLLRDVMGTTLIDYVPIYSEKQGVKFAGALAGPDAKCEIWADVLKPEGAEVLASYTMGMHAGEAAITSNTFGKGKAIYIGARIESASLGRVLNTLAATADARAPIETPSGVEVTVRVADQKRWIYLLNHTSEAQTVKLARSHKELISGGTVSGPISIDGYGVWVLAEG